MEQSLKLLQDVLSTGSNLPVLTNVITSLSGIPAIPNGDPLERCGVMARLVAYACCGHFFKELPFEEFKFAPRNTPSSVRIVAMEWDPVRAAGGDHALTAVITAQHVFILQSYWNRQRAVLLTCDKMHFAKALRIFQSSVFIDRQFLQALQLLSGVDSHVFHPNVQDLLIERKFLVPNIHIKEWILPASEIVSNVNLFCKRIIEESAESKHAVQKP